MSTALELLLEDEAMQTLVNEHEEVITEGAEKLMEFMDVVKEEVMAHPERFIEPGDVKATYENVRIFTEAAVASYLDQVTDAIANPPEEVASEE